MPRKDSESSCDSHSSHHEEDETLANDSVVNKYMVAAEITNAVLKEVITAVKEGVEVGTLCDLGDKLILDKTSKIFKNQKDLSKGIATPTCISVDNCICHFSPLKSDPPVILKNGQVVKVDLGVHIDGYIAAAAHTIVVGASSENKVTGKTAELLKATYQALEIAVRTLRVDNTNFQISANIDKTAAEYEVVPVENMLSHQLQRHRLDGGKQIIQNPGERQRQDLEKTEIEKHEVYAIDVIFSTGKGKPKNLDTRTTVFKRNDEVQYSLKMKASRTFLSECATKFGSMAFSLRSFEDEVKAKMGVVECEKHGLVRAFQVFYENTGDLVAQFKATVLVMPNGLLKIAGLPLDYSLLDTEAQLKDEDLIKVLKSNLKPKKVKADPAKEVSAAKP